jgi:hypothetical protein
MDCDLRAARPMRFGQCAGRRATISKRRRIRRLERGMSRAVVSDQRATRMAAAAGQSCSGSPYDPARRNVVRLVVPTTQLAVLG